MAKGGGYLDETRKWHMEWAKGGEQGVFAVKGVTEVFYVGVWYEEGAEMSPFKGAYLNLGGELPARQRNTQIYYWLYGVSTRASVKGEYKSEC